MKIRKLALVILLGSAYIPLAHAGGILTNTNQSARFARLMALEASTNIDAAYYNPAGLSKLKHEGFQFSFSNQSAFQKRQITATSPLYDNPKGTGMTKFYEGTASAPIIPSFQGAYKKGKWVLSGSLAVVGGGGKATFNNGLPMFETAAASVPGTIASNFPFLQTGEYTVDQYMTGSNFIYGAQLGGTYEINKMFSAYAGFRLNIVNNSYKGHLKNLQVRMKTIAQGPAGFPEYDNSMASPIAPLSAMLNNLSQIPNPDEATITKMNNLNLLAKASGEGAYLNSKQSGWGISPIIGFNFNYDKWNVGMKYEFKTNLNVENKTTQDDTGMNNNGMFANGAHIGHDIPALFTIGASYQILPQLNANVGYHHFFDKHASMSDGKQKHISGTDEYLAGVEYQIDKMFLISAGGQITRYGIKDGAFQSDLSFSVNSYSLGFGGAVNLSDKIQLNIGYFFTDYANYDKDMAPSTGVPNSKNVYTRTNKVFSAGIDFAF